MKRSAIRELTFRLIYSLEIQKVDELEEQVELYIQCNEIEENDAKEYIKDATMLLRLTFIGESADNPVIAGLIRKFPELDISILFGDLSQIQMVQFGRMIIGLDGKEDQIKDAIKSLMEQDLKVEVIGYVQRRTHATA